MNSAAALFSSPDSLFIDMVQTIHGHGTWEENHTNVKALTHFGLSYRLKVSAQQFPILTLKEVKWKAALKELIWYLKGDHHIKEFKNHSKIWDQWATEEGHLESAYGRYWRYYPHNWKRGLPSSKSDKFYTPEGEVFASVHSPWVVEDYSGELAFDQLRYVVDKLKSEERSRRLLIHAFYPPNGAVSKLPPCHHTITLTTQNIPNGHDKTRVLNLHLNQRSMDVGIGFSFNQFAYCVLLLLLCQETNHAPGYFMHTITDAHIYEDHLQPLRDCIRRPRHSLPTITLPQKSIFDLDYEDAKSFKLSQYQYEPFIPLTCHE